MKCEIIFEDDTLIAINKPEGIASISENDLSIETIHSSLENTTGSKIWVVHRLDKEVSGIILFAKNAKEHKLLNKQFENREISKTYLALLNGHIDEVEGQIDIKIKQFGSGRMGVSDDGKSSITKFKVIKNLNNKTLVEAYPVTGRRHQLRVHFYSIGHSIVGDKKYGFTKEKEMFSRLMLHAYSIQFNHNGSLLKLLAPTPESFNSILSIF